MHMTQPAFLRLLCALSLAVALVGCGTNPVTGKPEISFYSTASQIQMGEQRYAPSQQSQGGEYYLDDDLNTYVSGVTRKLVEASTRVFPEAPALPYEIVVLNNSVPNAWALPGGKMAINRGLLVELNDESELAAVLGHEIIHAAANHGAAQMSRGALLGLGAMAAVIASADSRYADLIGLGAQAGSAAWMARYSRDDELESDRYGMLLMAEAGYDPSGAVRLQETFVRMSEGRRQDFISGLFASHPPSQQRVDANRAYRAELPREGITGRDAYQSAIAQLQRDAKAYEAQEKATEALKSKDAQAALIALDRAVQIQPDEGQFWEMRGHAWKMKGNTGNADTAYTSAISKNPNYYRHWLARGILRKEVGREADARWDLERSQELLPNAVTAYHLGELAEIRGDQTEAIGLFRQAARGGGALGEAAQGKLVRYDLSEHPGRYFATGLLVSERGELIVALRNDSGMRVHSVRIRLVDVRTGLGRDYRIGGALGRGEQVTLRTGIAREAAHFRVDVVAAAPIDS